MNGKTVLTRGDISLLKYLRHNFKIIDDFPREYAEERRLVMEEKASFLLHIATRNGMLWELMPGLTEHAGGLIGELPESKAVKSDGNKFTTIGFGTRSKRKVKTEWFKFHLFPWESHPYRLVDRHSVDNDVHDRYNKLLWQRSLYRVCADISLRRTPEDICRILGECRPTPYGEIKIYKRSMRQWGFEDSTGLSDGGAQLDDLRSRNPDSPEENLVDDLVTRHIYNSTRNVLMGPPFEKQYEDGWQAAYSFRNEYDEVTQKVFKTIVIDTSANFDVVKKVLVPCTTWLIPRSGSRSDYCIPSPAKQPLFNLNKLSGRGEADVLLCDSIEVAALNQPWSDFVWTSFLCDEDCYDQVDWTPLKNRTGTIYLLVTNHSGQSLEQAYLKARSLCNFLTGQAADNKKGIVLDPHEDHIRFVQVDVDHQGQAYRTVHSTVSSYLDARRETPPLIREQGTPVNIMNYAEFQMLCDKAENTLAPRVPIHMEDEPQEPPPEALSTTSKQGKDPIDYVIRPILRKGKTTVMYAQEKLGKSNLTISICAVLANGHNRRRLLDERWWSVPLDMQEGSAVLYFDFEKGAEEVEDFRDPYLPGDEQERQECLSRFRIVDMEGEGLAENDFTEESNHQIILDRIRDFENELHPRRRVDVVVFDTLNGMLGGAETSGAWDKVRRLFKKIENQGIAILLLDHTNRNGDHAGQTQKRRDSFMMFKLWRYEVDARGNKQLDRDTNKPLTVPFEVMPDAERSWATGFDRSPFMLRLSEKGRWEVYDPDDNCNDSRNEKTNQALTQLADEYLGKGYRQSGIWHMLGISDTEYHRRKQTTVKGRKKANK